MKALLSVLLGLVIGCRAPDSTAPESPYVLVLGTAQDAGLPQIACTCVNCSEARVHPARARFGSSLLLVDPRTQRRWLFDATPDLREQVELARGHGRSAEESSGRPALFDGIFLTHAHMGHYTGLMHLGYEAYGSETTVVHLTPRFAEYLEANGPWSQLVEMQQIELHRVEAGESVTLATDLRVTSFAVPHRDEYSDTVGFRIDGPSSSLVYLPDIDKWERWDREVEELIGEVDFALLDGSFYSGAEIPMRDMSEIPHPFIAESLQRFEPLSPELRARVIFTHLNHSNPAADPESEAAREVRSFGARIARRGDLFEL